MNDLNIVGISKGSIITSFDQIAHSLFNKYKLQVNDNWYRLLDIEFYYYAPDLHEDVYAHKHESQLQSGKWYFHGSGIDITIGNGKHHGGILIRAIGKVSANGKPENKFIEKQIHGPLNVKTEICSNFKDVFGETPNYMRLEDVSMELMGALMPIPKHIIKTKRINLNPDNDPSQEYYDARYRYVIFPKLKLANKAQIAYDMLEQYPQLEKAGVNEELGSIFLK